VIDQRIAVIGTGEKGVREALFISHFAPVSLWRKAPQ
jgi:thioredoxin reductase